MSDGTLAEYFGAELTYHRALMCSPIYSPARSSDFSVISFGGSRLADARALRLIAWTCIVFHSSSGVLELYAYAHGASVAIVGNVVARAIIVGIFAYLSKDQT